MTVSESNGYRGPLISHLCIVSSHESASSFQQGLFVFSLFSFLTLKSQVCGHSYHYEEALMYLQPKKSISMMIRPPVAGLVWVEDLETVMMAGEQEYREVVNDGTWVRLTRLRGCGNVFPAVVVRDRCVGLGRNVSLYISIFECIYSLFVPSMPWPLAGSPSRLFCVKMTLLRLLQPVPCMVPRRRGQWPACLLNIAPSLAAPLPLSYHTLPPTPGPLPPQPRVAHIIHPKTTFPFPSQTPTPRPRSRGRASSRSHFTFPLRLPIPPTLNLLSSQRVCLLHPLPQQSHSVTHPQSTLLARPFSTHND